MVDLAAPEDSTDLVAMVRDGRCEAGITEATGLPADLAVHDIGRQELLLIVSTALAARSGLGAALVPEPIAAVAAALGAIVVRPLPAVTRHIALVHSAGPLAPAAARFVELAVSTA